MADVRSPTMPDAETAVEAPLSPTHVTIRREDYRPPDWLVPAIGLKFTLGIEKTIVRSILHLERSEDAECLAPIRLNGDGLVPIFVDSLGEGEPVWRMD